MSKFKIGDHVRVTTEGYWFDQTGVVAEIEPGGKYPVFVDLDIGGQVAFTEHELILADVVEDAKPVNHGANCPWCAPEPQPAVCDPRLWSIPQRHYVGMYPESIKNADLVEANNAKFVAKMNAAAEAGPVNVRAQTLRTAEKLINGDRAKDYGEPKENFGRIADLWNAQFGKKLKAPFTAGDVALALVHLKLSRLANTPDHEDSFVDACGYLALGAEIAEGL